MRSYIQRWSIIKNSAENGSDERAIDAFVLGLHRSDLVEEMGRIKPKAVPKLMEIANRFADGEDAYHKKGHGRPNVIDQVDIITKDVDLAMTTTTTRAIK
jgi:hypothetical protein